ncbi:MAG TPA: metallophosphoesterase family protein [Candidatus Dormibacteraeota bacterium]|nr:metallophosphoesterase family protein [Candidatus Dormibacteraeota bacterium]
MRYLIISDIHANLMALDTALAAAKGKWDKAVCLGDLVGYGPDPNEVVERIRSLEAETIRGNHDKAVAGVEDIDDFNPIARAAVLWTREQLRPENREYLQNLPKGPKAIDGFTIVHGSVYDEDEYVYSPELAVDPLKSAPTPVTFFGHTHLQGGFTLRGEDAQALHTLPGAGRESVQLKIESGTNYLLNPGSVGQPRDGDARSGFAIADLKQHTVEFWRVPYDIAQVQQRMTQAGLPQPLVLRLTFGR